MERFAINILHQKIHNICRLCGVDNPDKVPIIVGDDSIICLDDEDDEPTMVRKIEECVGIWVSKTDQMPQQICTLCVDKVNDFYEYRLMCASTNHQTRLILNLPPVQPSKLLIKQEPTPDVPAVETSECNKPGSKRGIKARNQQNDDIDSKDFLGASSEKRIKKEYPCQYCKETYENNVDLERHLVVKHTPLVHKFGCASCTEHFGTASEFKDHNLWHKLTRTMFHCFRCKKKFARSVTLSKHLELNACGRVSRRAKTPLAPDLRCKLCNKVFKTQNLYEWHGCFLRARANCPKCGKYFVKKNLLTRHYMLYCTGKLVPTEPELVMKEELETLGADGLPDASLAAVRIGREGKKKGVSQAAEPENTVDSMKEETLDLPFPPLLDIPEVKLESTLDHGQPAENADFEGYNRKRAKETLDTESEKINTLLRTGADVDGNSDIATISSMLSSVNEAIATISNARKMRKKKDATEVHGPANIAVDSAFPECSPESLPTVVISMDNLKQESEDLSMINTALETMNVGETNEITATSSSAESVDENSRDPYGTETACDVGESFADDDNNSDSEEVGDAGVNNIRESVPTVVIQSDANADSLKSNDMTLPFVQVKDEPITFDGESEADVGEYETAISFLAIKHEPVDVLEANVTEAERTIPYGQDDQDAPSSSSPAVGIKIKKEKGLHNATVVEEETNPIPTPQPANVAEPEQTVARKEKKNTKHANTQIHCTDRSMRSKLTATGGTEVRIKQERLDPDNYHHNKEVQNAVTDGTDLEPCEEVRIKQEPLEDSLSSHSHPELPVAIVAFDGTLIKQEAIAKSLSLAPCNGVLVNTDRSNQACPRNFVDPVRRASGTESSRSSNVRQAGTNGTGSTGPPSYKFKKMINPFALLKQRSLAAAEAQGAVPNEESGPSVNTLSLPVITQVSSMNNVDHVALPTESPALETPVPDSQPTNDLNLVETESKEEDLNLIETESKEEETISPTANLESGLTSEANVEKELAGDIPVSECDSIELRIASVTTVGNDLNLCNEKGYATLGEAIVNTDGEASPTPLNKLPGDAELRVKSADNSCVSKSSSDDEVMNEGELSRSSKEKTPDNTLICKESNEEPSEVATQLSADGEKRVEDETANQSIEIAGKAEFDQQFCGT